MAQIKVPIANFGTTSWVQGVGDSDADWFDELDEGLTPDANYWNTPGNPAALTIATTCEAVTDPAVNTGHTGTGVNRKSAAAGRQIDIEMAVDLDGSFGSAAVATFVNVDNVATSRSVTLTSGQVDTFRTNGQYAAPHVRTKATAVGTGTGRAGLELLHVFSAPDAVVNGEATPAGVSVTAAVGGASVTGAATITPAGVEITASAGVASVAGAATTAPAGVEITASTGVASVAGAATIAPSGVEMVASVGTAVASGDAGSQDGTALPGGVAAVSAVGSVTPSGGALIEASGVSATSGVGAPILQGAASVSPLGVEMLSAVGTAVASSGGDAEALPAGVQMVASVGSVVAIGTTGGIVIPMFHGARAVGPDIVRRDAVARPRGVAMHALVGHPIATGTATAAPVGVAMTSAVGDVEARGIQNPTDEEWARLLMEAA